MEGKLVNKAEVEPPPTMVGKRSGYKTNMNGMGDDAEGLVFRICFTAAQRRELGFPVS